jgi:hypothetical protein
MWKRSKGACVASEPFRVPALGYHTVNTDLFFSGWEIESNLGLGETSELKKPEQSFRLNIVDDSDDFLPPPPLVDDENGTSLDATAITKRPGSGRPPSSQLSPSSSSSSSLPPNEPAKEEEGEDEIEDEALQRDRKRRKLNSAQDERLRLIEAREKEELERERENEDDGDGNGLDVLEIRPCDEEVSRGMSLTSPLTWMMWYEAQLVQLVVMLMLISGNCDLPFFETIPPSPSTADQPQLPLSPFSSPHLSNLLSPQLKH